MHNRSFYMNAYVTIFFIVCATSQTLYAMRTALLPAHFFGTGSKNVSRSTINRLHQTDSIIRRYYSADAKHPHDAWQVTKDLLASPPVARERFAQAIKKIDDKFWTLDDGFWTLKVIRTLFEQAEEHKIWEGNYSCLLGDILLLAKVDIHHCNTDPLHQRLFVPNMPLLHEATKHDLPLCIKMLMQHKAKINAVDIRKRIALHHVQSQEAAKILIDHGSYINAQDHDYNTPLHTVPTPLVPMLMKHGADPSLQCCDIFKIIDSDESKKYREQLWSLQFEDPGNIKNIECGHYDHARALVYGWHTPIMKAIVDGDKERVQTLLELTPREITLSQMKTLHVLAKAKWYRSGCQDHVYPIISGLLKRFEQN